AFLRQTAPIGETFRARRAITYGEGLGGRFPVARSLAIRPARHAVAGGHGTASLRSAGGRRRWPWLARTRAGLYPHQGRAAAPRIGGDRDTARAAHRAADYQLRRRGRLRHCPTPGPSA